MKRSACLLFACGWATGSLVAAEHQVISPDGKLQVTVSDEGGLAYAVTWNGKPVLVRSELGLEFAAGEALGPKTRIGGVKQTKIDTSWENRFGARRKVPGECTEARFSLVGTNHRSFGLMVRVFDHGVALRYAVPKESGMAEFTLTDEATAFRFAGDYRCWLGTPSPCAESFYRPGKLSELKPGHQGVLPLLVETPAAWVAIAESDLRDWAGMFLQGDGHGGARVLLADRADKKGKVVSRTPRLSPWRVILLGEKPADLLDNELVATLAEPSRIKDTSWIKPGASAWDSWWTGHNPEDPEKKTGVDTRGTTASHKQYIDFAAEMGWPYQVVDWFWYTNMTSYNKGLHSPPNKELADFSKPLPIVDVRGLVDYAKSKNVRLFIWAHSLDIETFGIERAMDHFASQGVVGLKIDFLNSQSQETVDWCERVLAAAAKRKLMVDFHGTYHPTGLARTWPNFITQEGVYGNEYDKMNTNVTPDHQLDLVFTRGLLGPMDYTPGGFLNRRPGEFKPGFPTQVQGTRARELALPVLYVSPLTVFCDHPANYRGQPGVEFYRGFPTAWDETVVLSAGIDSHAAIARKKDGVWRIGAINRNQPLTLELPLTFLGAGAWELQAFADSQTPDAPATAVEEIKTGVAASDVLKIQLAPAGGYAAVIRPKANP